MEIFLRDFAQRHLMMEITLMSASGEMYLIVLMWRLSVTEFAQCPKVETFSVRVCSSRIKSKLHAYGALAVN